MNVVYSYPVSLNAMNCISIHEFFSGCWAETEIAILSPCTLLSWHSSSVWSADRRHHSVSHPRFWDPERDRIRHVEAADNHLQYRQTHAFILHWLLSHFQHNFLSVSFHYALEPVLIYLLFWFTFLCYLIKKKKCFSLQIQKSGGTQHWIITVICCMPTAGLD